MSRYSLRRLLPLVAAISLLTACTDPRTESEAASLSSPSPILNEQTAADGLARFNQRRQELGLQPVVRNNLLDDAAEGHSRYQVINEEITHDQTVGNPGFTGATAEDRIVNANYQFTQDYAYGEVISRTADDSGTSAADDLIAAIYHRFVIFEPMFKEAGAGAAAADGGPTYFTTNFAANGLDTGLGAGNFVVYPYDGQQNVPRIFYSDQEVPDPVPSRNLVGYPISIHADILSTVTVTSFTVRPQGGSNLAVELLTNVTDPEHTTESVAAIVPLDTLTPATTYVVDFVGNVDGVAANRSWTFTTE